MDCATISYFIATSDILVSNQKKPQWLHISVRISVHVRSLFKTHIGMQYFTSFKVYRIDNRNGKQRNSPRHENHTSFQRKEQ